MIARSGAAYSSCSAPVRNIRGTPYCLSRSAVSVKGPWSIRINRRRAGRKSQGLLGSYFPLCQNRPPDTRFHDPLGKPERRSIYDRNPWRIFESRFPGGQIESMAQRQLAGDWFVEHSVIGALVSLPQRRKETQENHV